VVIAAHDAAATLGATLKSVVARLGPHDEVLVCDDGSRDDTVAVAEGLGDPRIRVLTGAHSGAPSVPRNRGIEAAEGDLIFFVDADDLALGDKFGASRAALADHPDAAMVFTDFQKVDAYGALLVEHALSDYEIIRRLGPGRVHRIEADAATRHLARENFVGTSGVAVRRDVLHSLGGFDVSLPNSEDRDLWFRIARRHPIVFLDEALHAYRVHADGISARPLRANVPARLEVLRRQLDHALDSTHAQDLRQAMANLHQSVAYEAFDAGDMATCRRAVRAAWKLRPQAQLARRYALSLLGAPLVRRLRDR